MPSNSAHAIMDVFSGSSMRALSAKDTSYHRVDCQVGSV